MSHQMSAHVVKYLCRCSCSLATRRKTQCKQLHVSMDNNQSRTKRS